MQGQCTAVFGIKTATCTAIFFGTYNELNKHEKLLTTKVSQLAFEKHKDCVFLLLQNQALWSLCVHYILLPASVSFGN